MGTQSSATLPRPIRYNNISYLALSWETAGQFAFELAKNILASGVTFDRIVAIAKGGWSWTRTMADFLNIDSVASMRIKSYTNVYKTTKPYIVQPLSESIGGMRVLLFDEIVDSGKTMKRARAYLKTMGVKSIKTAALCYKPHSIYKPDFHAFQTTAWVVMPHEIREFIGLSSTTWSNAGISQKEIIARFVKIGLQKEQVNYFFSLHHSESEKLT